MKKITITRWHLHSDEQAKKNDTRQKLARPKHYGLKLECAKCHKKLKLGDPAFRTRRLYFCQQCGENAEIE